MLLQWRKSSYSTDSANCVEVASSANLIHVRDSKDPDLIVISYTTKSWHAFIRAVQDNEFGG